MLKRALDIAASAAALIVLGPFLGLVAIAILVESGGPVFFRQERVGRGFRPFTLWKFRSMRNAPGPPVTSAFDQRVTHVGRLIRRTKTDELPQLWNVLRGDMSVVGPRPEVPQFVRLYEERYERILRVRPGLTDLASIRYRNEEAILADAPDPMLEYVRIVLPNKLDLADEYIGTMSLRLDLRIIVRTLAALFVDDPCRAAEAGAERRTPAVKCGKCRCLRNE